MKFNIPFILGGILFLLIATVIFNLLTEVTEAVWWGMFIGAFGGAGIVFIISSSPIYHPPQVILDQTGKSGHEAHS